MTSRIVTQVATGLAFSVALLASLHALDLSGWWGPVYLITVCVVVLVGQNVWFALFRGRVPLAEIKGARLDRAEQPCPRCDAAPRLRTGWCSACAEVMRHAPASALVSDVFSLWEQPTPRRLKKIIARDFVAVAPSGKRLELRGPSFAAHADLLIPSIMHGHQTLIVSAVDPKDPRVAWAQVQWQVAWHGRNPEAFTSVIRLVTDEQGLLAEAQLFVALPGAGSMSAPESAR